MGVAWRNRLLLTTLVLFALTGCGVEVPSAGTARVTSAETVALPPVSPSPASPAPDAGKHEALLNALRQARLPVSADGELEIHAANVACAMIARGMTPEDLAAAAAARFGVPVAKAQRLMDMIITTYC